jgi:quinol monooxygenase YgiN
MRRVMVRYRVKPDQVARNEELVRAVYAALHQREPTGLRYATFRLENGVTFVHIAETADARNPLSDLEAFQEFQKEIEARCDEAPAVTELHEIGAFRLFG